MCNIICDKKFPYLHVVFQCYTFDKQGEENQLKFSFVNKIIFK